MSYLKILYFKKVEDLEEMKNFLDMYYLQKFNQENINNLDEYISQQDWSNNTKTNTNSGPDDFC